jgi:hypothetical protein
MSSNRRVAMSPSVMESVWVQEDERRKAQREELPEDDLRLRTLGRKIEQINANQ